jgi:O-antigen ligase
MMFYAVYLFIAKYKANIKAKANIFLGISLISSIFLFITAATRGTFLGLIAGLLVFLGYIGFTSRKLRKWMLLGALGLMVIVSAGIAFKDTAFVRAIPGNRVFDISFSADTFKSRSIMWGIAIDAFQDRPILGWGPESFLFLFPKYFDPSYFSLESGIPEWFDRAHSIYFDYLVAGGALGLLSFLGIFGAFFYSFFKYQREKSAGVLNEVREHLFMTATARKKLLRGLFLALAVAYLVQGIVLFDILPIYICIFLFLSLSVYVFSSSLREEEIL